MPNKCEIENLIHKGRTTSLVGLDAVIASEVMEDYLRIIGHFEQARATFNTDLPSDISQRKMVNLMQFGTPYRPDGTI